MLSDRERLIRDLDLVSWRLREIRVFISDHIRSFDLGNHYIIGDLETETRETLQTLGQISESLRRYLDRIIGDLKTGDPETLETLRSSHEYISDIIGDPETWKDPDNLTLDNLTETLDTLQTPKI